jgi:hypothetical protein
LFTRSSHHEMADRAGDLHDLLDLLADSHRHKCRADETAQESHVARSPSNEVCFAKKLKFIFFGSSLLRYRHSFATPDWTLCAVIRDIIYFSDHNKIRK